MKIHGTSVPVLVLGAHFHGSLGIIRSLGEIGISVYGTYSERRGPAVYSKYCKHAFEWHYPSGSDEECVQELLKIGNEIGSPCILIPTWDETAVFVAQHYSELSRVFVYPRQDAELVSSVVSKKQMYLLAKRCGIPTAQITLPQSLADVEQFAQSAKFPVMLKASDGNRLKRRMNRKMVIVNTPRELIDFYRELEDPENPDLMLQEYIPARTNADWMFNGYFDANSDCLLGFTGQKLRQTPVYTGMTSLGICRNNSMVIKRTTEWMKQLGYKGILDIGYRYDHRDGEYKVLDVNPRIGATFRLFLGQDNMDVARALYLDMTGQPVPRSVCREGRKWMVELDFKSCLDYRRDGKLTLRSWWRSLRGVEEFGYFRRGDLRPLIHCLFTGAQTVFGERKRPRPKSVQPSSAPTIAQGAEMSAGATAD